MLRKFQKKEEHNFLFININLYIFIVIIFNFVFSAKKNKFYIINYNKRSLYFNIAKYFKIPLNKCSISYTNSKNSNKLNFFWLSGHLTSHQLSDLFFNRIESNYKNLFDKDDYF